MTENATLIPPDKLKAALESLFFLAERPLPLRRLVELLPEASESEIREAIETMSVERQDERYGVELAEVAGGYQLRTKPENSSWIFRLHAARPARLSRASMETLSIVAYRQPVTRPEIDEIRGVDSGPVLRNLLEKNLVRILGKREEPGTPLIYGTTHEFLEVFGLKSLAELPTLREYTELGQESLRKLEKLLPDQTQMPPSDPSTEAELDSEIPIPSSGV